MKKYTIDVTQFQQAEITVEADTHAESLAKAEEIYSDGDIQYNDLDHELKLVHVAK